MNRSTFPIRIAGVAGVIVLLTLMLVHPAGASLWQDEPGPRPTATPAPYLQLNPSQGVAGDATRVVAVGALWVPGGTVDLYWDDTSTYLVNAQVGDDGTFQTEFTTPTDPEHATVGTHRVLAIEGDLQAEADFVLIEPSPTPTPSSTHTPSATPSSSPTPPPSPVTPSPTAPPTPTFTPSPTLRPVTPMVTITPIPPTRPPVVTRPPVATRTNTPRPGTSTFTPTPSITPTPSHTPGPGTPSATPLPSATATATPADEITDTGSGWGTIFLWGFVLAGLLVVFRLLRVQSLKGQS